jgi:hypothetical protein|tara:strand:+ start:664 stop:1323 length:660 start_codon:yes stop_codon:yes gene_type:complete
MEKYYIMVNNQQEGPFTKEEIISKGFSDTSYIYNKSLGGWKKISEVAGFSSFEKKNEIKPETISSSILKNSDSSSVAVKSNRDTTPAGASSSEPSGSFTVTISPDKIEELKNKAHIVNDKSRVRYSWWSFDDEYISGSQYLGRSIIGVLLCIFIVGFYLQAVTAYKRSKSLGNSTSTNNFFRIWGGVSGVIGFTPAAPLNIIPHWYLWFSDGRNPNRRN